jgi:hypothetical protein
MRAGRGRLAVIVVGTLILLAIAIRLLLDPVAAVLTRRELGHSQALRGDFARVHVTLYPLGYEIWRFKLVPRADPTWHEPLFYAERVQIGLALRALVHGHITARVRLDGPKVIVLAKRTKSQLPDVAGALGNLVPARVERVEIRRGEVVYRDRIDDGHPELWLSGLELAAENLTTRASLAGGQPATVAAHGTLGRSGKLSGFVSANLFARKLDFAGNLAVRGWQVAELYALVEPATKLQTPRGTLDVYAEWKARDGAISGGVKPVLKDVEVRPTEASFGNKLKAWLADRGLHLFSDRVPGRNAVATVVPIEGKLDHPDLQLWPTVIGVVRNAFVEGVAAGFENLPPGASPEKETVIDQAKHAVKKSEGPPKAQPPSGPAGRDGADQKRGEGK